MKEMVHFNAIKHHLLTIKLLINRLRFDHTQNWKEEEENLKKIGSRTLDLYIGNLSVEEIKNQMILTLKNIGIHSEQAYKAHLIKQSDRYYMVTLSDSSEWVLRVGRPPLNVVHIHPGRYSPHTVRTHGNALKTAILILCNDAQAQTSNFDIIQVNELRQKIGLSPVGKLKELIKLKRLLKLISTSPDRII